MNAIDPNLVASAAVAELVKTLAKGMGEGGLRLLAEIRERFSKDERAGRSLANLEANPTDADEVEYFSKHLRRLLEEDPEFRARISALLPVSSQQTITASGNSVVDSATQASDTGESIQIIEAADQSSVTNVKQRRTTK